MSDIYRIELTIHEMGLVHNALAKQLEKHLKNIGDNAYQTNFEEHTNSVQVATVYVDLATKFRVTQE